MTLASSRWTHDPLIPRAIVPTLLEALSDSRAAVVVGPRQSGKTTLVRDLIRSEYSATYLTLDDAGTREAAETDPTGFIAELGSHTIIDEIQRVPDLLLTIKERLDRDQRRGQFLLTGSANIQTLATIRDALPGRAEYVRLWPLSQSEIERDDSNLVDALFSGRRPIVDKALSRTDYAARIAAGGFPEAFRRSQRSRVGHFDAYIDAIVDRDVPDVTRVRDPASVGRLFRLLAARSASLLSRQRLAQDIGLSDKTVSHHLRALEDLMLVRLHPAWHSNLSRRGISTPKVYVTDTGMLASVLGIDARRIGHDPTIRGMTFETFVAMELVKLSSWSDAAPRVFHYRDRDGREVDVLLERADGTIVGVEVKAAATARSADFRSLSYLREKLGDRFRCGVLLHAGALSLPFGDRLYALPISSLWS